MSQSRRYIDDLRLAHVLADQADHQSLAHFHSDDLVVEEKPDFTLVSDADRAVEDQIRLQLSTSRSRDSVLGEERGTTGSSSRQWIIDPIDGTSNFVRGVPVWATLIGLVEDGEVVVGLVSAPALKRRWWAAKDMGAFAGTSLMRAKQLQVSKVSQVEDAFFSYSSLEGWLAAGRGRSFLDFQQQCWRTRAFGDFWSYMMVAEGTVDVAAEPELALYDMAALVPIVQEAGGRFTSLDGEDGPWGSNAVATNGLLHAAAISGLEPR
ncbi:inositol monophosphatase family protein [Actinomyces minihominis]|uniref:inositol monophosphatase family protein n=1 Tax=Actinomyces minihominis TaxID=2002838 RepID=UPI000C07028B|nr:inositol monophosphatase family protein [Actinomyces minihominis]